MNLSPVVILPSNLYRDAVEEPRYLPYLCAVRVIDSDAYFDEQMKLYIGKVGCVILNPIDSAKARGCQDDDGDGIYLVHFRDCLSPDTKFDRCWWYCRKSISTSEVTPEEALYAYQFTREKIDGGLLYSQLSC